MNMPLAKISSSPARPSGRDATANHQMLTDVRQPSRIPLSSEIGAAYACFDEGRPEETLKLLEMVPPDCAVGASLRLAAGALIAERNGNAAIAEEGFEKVFKAGIPLPALLRESGRFFKRSHRFERAYHCYAILQTLAPGPRRIYRRPIARPLPILALHHAPAAGR